MDYGNQAQAGRALSTVGGGSNAPRTLSQRLEAAAYTLMSQCGRVEEVLSKINGTPRNPNVSQQEKIATAVPMAQSVEALEQGVKRLCDLIRFDNYCLAVDGCSRSNKPFVATCDFEFS